MAIKIQTEKPEIPIEIGNLKFTFDVSDESIKDYRKSADRVRKELESMKIDEDDNKAQEQIKDALRRGFTIMLGEGSFEKIYALTPSSVICVKYFYQIAEGIEQELNNLGITQNQKEKAQKYLAKKK